MIIIIFVIYRNRHHLFVAERQLQTQKFANVDDIMMTHQGKF